MIMMEKNKRTFVEAKKARGVSDKARESSKTFREYRKLIHKSIGFTPKTIPQIAAEINLPLETVTFNLMTCRKYGQIEVTGLDERDEYFLYQLKKNPENDDED
jgi:hypothetical protein